MEIKTDRYINENLQELKEDWIIIQANIGSGKTTSLYQLWGQSVLSIGARNSLGLQTMEKHPSILSEHHLQDLETGYTKSKTQLHGKENLFINYSSSHKLSFPKEIQTNFDWLTLDEPILTWGHSVNPDFINLQAEQELIYRLLHTPKVVLMGADFPPFLLKELYYLASLKNKTIKYVKYEYPIFEGMQFQFVSNGDEMNSEIDVVLQKLLKTKGTINPTKGVLMATELGKGIPNQVAKYRQAYPELNIVGVWSGNQEQHNRYLKQLADPNSKTDIDMLITNQSWGMGIDIRNEFDLIVQNYLYVPTPIKTKSELIQDLRDRDCKKVVVAPRKQYVKPKNPFIVDTSQTNVLLEHLQELGIETKQFFERNPYTGDFATRDIQQLKRFINFGRWRHNQLYDRFEDYEDEAVRLGGEVSQTFSKAITVHLPNHVKASLWDDPAYLSKAEAGLGRPIVFEKDKAQWDEGEYRDNLKRRKDIDNHVWAGAESSLKSQILKLHKAIYETRKIFMKLTDNEMIITNYQFSKSHLWLAIKKDKHKYSALCKSYGWYFDIDNETALAPIYFLKEILRKYNYYTEIVKGSPNTRKKLKPLVRKENLTEFNKWKKEQPKVEGKNIVLGDYLLLGLEAGTLKFNELKRNTQNYIKAHDHLLISEYRL